MKGVLLSLLFFMLSLSVFSFHENYSDSFVVNEEKILLDSTLVKERKNVRAKAIIFTVLTGPLGGHRVYLGTRPGAPIIYSITLGGFGILPLVDLAHLLFKKDISSFEKNPKIMMWSK